MYIPNTDEEARAKIPIFLPHITIQPATLISLLGYAYTPIHTEGEYGYCKYFQKRWEDGKAFINLEQDIVVWPGAVKEIWECPNPWCGYDFHLPNHQMRNLEKECVGIPIGCVKLASEAIHATPGIWETPIAWVMCEQIITKQLRKHGISFHQHHPGVVNANPAFLHGKET